MKPKTQRNYRNQIGQAAESAALNYLQRHGLTLIEKNFHCRFGEIDLIMQQRDTLVFIEVRCRQENAIVSAIESITPQKMRKIQRTAEYFSMRYREMPNCRFDVVAMTYSRDKIGYAIEWITDAF